VIVHDDPIARFLDAICSATIEDTDAYAPDAELDATVPGWRSRTVGERAIKSEYARWFAHPARFIDIERLPVRDGEVVTYELEWRENGVRHRGHHAHRFTVADGKIILDKVWCGGRWPEPLLQRMSAR
jgi:hypothetical protein